MKTTVFKDSSLIPSKHVVQWMPLQQPACPWVFGPRAVMGLPLTCLPAHLGETLAPSWPVLLAADVCMPSLWLNPVISLFFFCDCLYLLARALKTKQKNENFRHRVTRKFCVWKSGFSWGRFVSKTTPFQDRLTGVLCRGQMTCGRNACPHSLIGVPEGCGGFRVCSVITWYNKAQVSPGLTGLTWPNKELRAEPDPHPHPSLGSVSCMYLPSTVLTGLSGGRHLYQSIWNCHPTGD